MAHYNIVLLTYLLTFCRELYTVSQKNRIPTIFGITLPKQTDDA